MPYLTAREIYQRRQDSYKDRKFLYLFPRPEGRTYNAVNYDATNNQLNTFLALFDVWGTNGGQHKVSEDENHQEVWFEVDEEFYYLALHSDTFRQAIEKLGVKIVTDYPFFKKNPWTEDWKGMAHALRTDFGRIALGWDLREEEY